jgi:hypothetical protein
MTFSETYNYVFSKEKLAGVGSGVEVAANILSSIS